VPSLVGAAEQLADAGYEVDVFTYRQAGQPTARFRSPRIQLKALGVEGLADHSTAGLRSAVKRAGWLPSAARAPLARTYQVFGAGLARGSRLAARARTAVVERPRAYACVIGVDPDGLALAETLAHGAPLVYYSLELLLSWEITSADERRLKEGERALSQRAAFVIVQDADRGRLLAEDNSVAWERVALVPNAPPGPARRQATRYWHTRFELPAESRVVIHSGSLGEWTGIEAIVESAAEWPRPWVLVIHTRYDAESSSYVDDLQRRAAAGRVFFSLKPVPHQDYEPLIDGADVGIAFYIPRPGSAFTQRNVQTIGLSSGKLAYYLRAGLPVIVNSGASIAGMVDAAAIGASVDSTQAIGPALERIAKNYASSSDNAIRFFDEQLDFSRAFAEVIRRVDRLR
jgi:hypothetical protein